MATIAKFILQRLSIVTRSDANIEDPAFQMHSVLTSRALLVLAMCLFVKMLATPMSCYGLADSVVGKEPLEAYCALQDFYGIPNYQQSSNQTSPPESNTNHPTYFHMVPVILVIQSLLFYLPYYIWKRNEKGNVSNLTFCFRHPIAEYKDDVLSPEQQSNRIDLIVQYLVRTWGKHRNLAFVYYGCVALNFAVTLVQIGLIDVAFSSEFSTDGVGVYRNVLFADHEERTDRISAIFPRIIVCTFRKISPEGYVTTHNAFCALPMNFLNERILVLGLSWFFLLTIVGFVAFLCWAFIFCIPCCQNRYLGNSVTFLTPSAIQHIMNENQFETSAQDTFKPSNIGDWFQLWLLSKNMNSIHYDRLIQRLRYYPSMPPREIQSRNRNKTELGPLINNHERAYDMPNH